MRKKRKLRARAAVEAERSAEPEATDDTDGVEAAEGDPAEGDAEEPGAEGDGEGADAEDAGAGADSDGEGTEAAADSEGKDAASDSEGEGEGAASDSEGDDAAADSEDGTLADFEGDGADAAADPEDAAVTDSETDGDAADEEVVGDGAAEGQPDDPDAELTPAFSLDPARVKSILESLLFAAEKPLSPLELKRLTGFQDTAAIQAALESLTQDYVDRGVSLYDVAGGYQFRTHPDNSEYVQRLVVGRPVRLSRAQLEALAIVAYRQPVTRPEIDDIRGVDSGSTLKVLLDRSLIRVLGKKEEPGRPLLYGTSKEFLEFFNLRELRDLPTLREFHELTEESLREVEALDQADKEAESAAEAAAQNGNGSAGDDAGAVDEADDGDDDDEARGPLAPH